MMIPANAMTAPARKARLAPFRKAPAGTGPVLLNPPNMAENTSGGIMAAATAPMIAKLRDCPTNLMVEMVPDAMPRWRLSTEPMTELVLGAENSPIPIPRSSSVAVK